MDTARTLLVAVLAVKENRLTAAQFAEAYAAWLQQTDAPFLDVLVQRGWLTPDDTVRLEKLVAEEIARHGTVHASLAQVESSVWQSIAQVQPATWDRSLAGALLPPPGVSDQLTRIRRLFEASSPGERYTRLHRHAAGGIGQVWLVRDEHLGREVALKELRPETAGDVNARARFLEEARITGQLEHPGIVPVYELLAPAGQQPFYIMRFVKGRTLSAAVADYHRRCRAGQANPLARNALLQAFVTICQTLAYAHSRGILHRDLKGQNVLLGDFGEVIVLDWGLAKRVEQKETAGPAGFPTAPGTWSSSLTQAGQVMGTPAYMAPEQAAGSLDQIGARTDVYGLGAMLYEILTGQPPFSASADTAPAGSHAAPTSGGQATDKIPDVRALLQRVINEAPLRPRQVCAGVPPALESICLHALAKKPVDRYASAGDLAKEIQRWLADEPVQAYREPLRVRLGRWARRNKTLVTGAVVLLVAAVVGLTTSTVLIGQEQARTQVEAERARDNFRLAQSAVDRYFVQISEERLLNVPGLQKVREELLQTARAYYEEFIRKHQDDASLQSDLGKALFNLAKVSAEIGKPEDALMTMDKAITLFEKLAKEAPSVTEHKIYLGKCYTRRGFVFFGQNRNKEAEMDCLKAREILEELKLPANADVQRTLGHSILNLGRLYERKGDKEKELKAHQEALAVYQKLVSVEPENRDFLSDLAAGYINLAKYYSDKQQYALALEHTRQARDLHEKLVKNHPGIIQFQQDLAKSLNNLGIILGDKPEGLARHRQAAKIRQRLADQNPHVPDYRSDLATTYFNIARYYEARWTEAKGRKDKKAATAAATAAELAYKTALGINRSLAADYPKVPRYAADVAVVEVKLGDLWFDANPQAARPLYEGAIHPLEEILKSNPSMYHRVPLRNAYWSLAQLGVAAPSKRHAWQRALELADKDTKSVLQDQWIKWMVSKMQKGEHATAAREAELLAKVPELPLHRVANLGRVYASCTVYAFETGEKKLADEYATRCMALLLRAEKAGFLQDPSARETLELYRSLPPLAARSDFQALLKRAQSK